MSDEPASWWGRLEQTIDNVATGIASGATIEKLFGKNRSGRRGGLLGSALGLVKDLTDGDPAKPNGDEPRSWLDVGIDAAFNLWSKTAAGAEIGSLVGPAGTLPGAVTGFGWAGVQSLVDIFDEIDRREESKSYSVPAHGQVLPNREIEQLDLSPSASGSLSGDLAEFMPAAPSPFPDNDMLPSTDYGFLYGNAPDAPQIPTGPAAGFPSSTDYGFLYGNAPDALKIPTGLTPGFPPSTQQADAAYGAAGPLGGYRNGGVSGFFDGGVLPPGMSPLAADAAAGGLSAMGTIIALLTEIRDLLRAVLPAPQVPGAGVGDNALGAPGLESGQNFLGELTQGLPGALPISDAIKAVGGVGSRPLPTRTAGAFDLLNEGNPMALAAIFGYAVGDYSRAGGQGSGVITANDGPDFNASGQLYSDTAALVDRSFTSLDASMKAGFDQLMDVMAQIRDQLVQISADLVGTAANAAVSLAGGPAGAATGSGMAFGGPVIGGVPGKDSVPLWAMPGEHMLTVADVNAMGGQAGVYAFRRALHTGSVRGFAAGGAVNANATVGADFYGLSQVPVIGAIVSMLTSVLLSVIGVQVQARDTMVRLSDEFRQFRGDFQAFNAEGRLLNDTSGLMDRSGTSTEEAADERVRILKIVIKELVEYIVHNLIVPIAKAVGKAAVAAGASAAGTAISNAGGPGTGSPVAGIVTGLINAGGDAAVDIGAQVFEDFAIGLTDVLTDGIAAMLQSSAPGLVQGIFGQGLSGLFPTGSLMAPAMGGGIAAVLAALFGTAAVFDDGGLAVGTGLMPKATVAPERVLSPRQTESFDRLVAAITNSNAGAPAGNRTIHAPIAVYGSESAAHEIRDLLEKIDV
ncbi:hypothetical protein [Mycobacterium sp. SMC-11]|uniref:hypothetical protein n=1 Tax=Mycobacterium sp. SMC-11 TaxID=3385969 RepID=UPI00390C7799